jgi:hypothetical protein
VRVEFGVELPVDVMLDGQLTVRRLAALMHDHQLRQAADGDVRAALEWIAGLSDDEVATLVAQEPGTG